MKAGTNKTRQVRILLMEDDGTVAHLIQLHLQSRGYAVDLAFDGRKGLDQYAAGKHDILIIDQRMPVMSGLDVIRELRNKPPLPPILMISALGSEEVAVEALKLGALDYVIKDPYARFLESLPLIIEDALKRHRQAAELQHATEERNRWLHELKQRVKELGCLYGLEKLFASAGDDLGPVLEEIANIIPHACRYETICCTRLRIRDREYHSANYIETPWHQEFPVKEFGTVIGALDIGFRERPPVPDHELFSPEERELLHAISERLGQFFDRWRSLTELKQSNAELRKLTRAVEQSPAGVMVTDAQGLIEYVNPSFTTMTGFALEEIRGQNPRMLKSGERSAEEYRELWETITAGREWRGEFHNRRKGGDLYWDYSIIAPILNERGEITHFVAMKEDITSRKQAEQLQTVVLNLSARLAGCPTEDEISRLVVEGIREQMGIDRVGLFLGDPANPPFRGTYGTDMQGRTSDEHNHVWDIGYERDVADLFEGAAYKTGLPLGNPDAQPGEENLSTTLVALRQAGLIFGVISIDNRISRRPITRTQIVHIALLAEVLGNTLQVARAREALRASIEEVRRANDELEAFNRAMVGRENRVIEMKEEINQLLVELGREPKFPVVWKQAGTDVNDQPGPG